MIEILYGEKKFEPVQYRVISKFNRHDDKTFYYVETDYMTYGPFDSAGEAQLVANRMSRYG